MRCKNCGWPNKPNETKCVKCHAPLVADDIEDTLSLNNGNGGEQLGKTVMEDQVFGPSSQPIRNDMEESRPERPHPTKQATVASQQCPKCGYPVRPGTDKCPNCKFDLTQQGRTIPESRDERPQPYTRNGETTHRPTRMNTGEGAKFRGTVNPYMMNMELDPTFVLKPLKRVNERHDYEEQEYEGKEVVLNRDNTEPGNSSITSRQQAVVTRIDGKWYIEDKSEQKTTFVQATKQTELHDGDIILLGNRLFEFHE